MTRTASSACRICGGPLALLHRGAGSLEPAALAPTCHAVGAHGDLHRCASCGTVHQPGLPAGDALVELYRDMADPSYLDEEAGRRATARRLLARLERHVRPGRLLEVGCGHGLLLDEARARGWDVRGLEPSRAAAGHAREVLRLDVAEETLATIRPAGGRFDAVVLVDVLEHLEDPAAALRASAALLAPGGALLLVTPDPSAPVARLAGARWWGYLPAHAHLIPRRALRALLVREGLVPVDDAGLWRTFTLAYWARGLGERAGSLARLLARAPGRRPVTLSLGDERVIVARAGVDRTDTRSASQTVAS